MIKTSGGPLPTTRYPTVPRLVWATWTGADTTDAVPVVFPGDEPHAPSATDTRIAPSPAVIPRRNGVRAGRGDLSLKNGTFVPLRVRR